VDELYEKYKSTQDIGLRQEYAWTLTKELVEHSEIEQMLVYPLLKFRPSKKAQAGGLKSDNNAEHLHDRSLQEHQEIRELLYTLDQTKVDDPTHPAKLKAAMEATLQHVKEEEGEVLPLIESGYSEEELERVGSAFKYHKYIAPTRPHPSAPLQGPPGALGGLASKPFDIARDVIRNITEKQV